MSSLSWTLQFLDEHEHLMLPCINPDNTSFHVVHSESIGPAAAARLLVDGASAFTAHGRGLYPGQTSIPVCPKQNAVKGKKFVSILQ